MGPTTVKIAALLLTLVAQAPASYDDRLAQWRKARLADAAGWTTVVALGWLPQGTTRLCSGEGGADLRLPATAPAFVGTLHVEGRAVRFDAAPGVAVTADGSAVTSLPMIPDETRLETGTLTLTIIERAGRLGLRVRDRDSPGRRAFTGLDYFPVSARARVEARFVPYDPPRTATIVNVLGDPVDFVSPGELAFRLDGVEHRLQALYETPEQKDLWVIFRDRTSGVTTYPAGRYLHVPLPRDGVADLDFNFAYNPPCAFTAFATCPLPPRHNWLKAAIEAGEKMYGH